MSRFTKKDLIETIKEVNLRLKENGSKVFYKYEARNNYHAVDQHDETGCVRNLDCHEPPRVLSERVYEDYSQWLIKK